MQYTIFQNTLSFLKSSTPCDTIERWERFKECLRQDAREASEQTSKGKEEIKQKRKIFMKRIAQLDKSSTVDVS